LNLALDVLNRIGSLNVQSDRLTRESFNEDLHCITYIGDFCLSLDCTPKPYRNCSCSAAPRRGAQ
jgi:hypothetical protein